MDRRRDERSTLFETHKGYDPRVIFFHFVIAVLLLILVGGLAYQQLIRTDLYHEREKVQNQRRILVPGPRGNIYDRQGRLLVGNRARFAVTLHLDELRAEFRREYLQIRKNYRESGDQDLPAPSQLEQIARYTVVQRYLDRVNLILARRDQVDGTALKRHFNQSLLLPYILVDDLQPSEYARLLEQLPVTSPLQVYTSSTRHYPYGSAAAHTLGYLKSSDDVDLASDFPGDDLTTFAMKGTVGVNGLERQFDSLLQGVTGGTIYRVDPAGYRVEPPLEKRLPVQGRNLVTSLDIDLQLAAEKALAANGLKGAAVALDIATGEALVLASYPSYDLNAFAPRLAPATAIQIETQGAWLNRAIQGVYPPGSAFKILTTVAGLRSGWLTPETTWNCQGSYRVGNRDFDCHDHHAHGELPLDAAIEKSCNVYFYKAGVDMGVDTLAAEARRFGFGRPTGIELPFETTRSVVPDPAWKLSVQGERWFPGDTATLAIGQSYLLVSPLQMAAFTASFARGQTSTPPSLLHVPDRPRLQTEPLGLSALDYTTVVHGMEQVTQTGTARILTTLPAMRLPGLRVAGKTGTAQKRVEGGQTVNFAWFICFAPVERPEIAIAVVVEGDTPGEETGGGRYAVPVAQAILSAWRKQ